jgi:hypothetical protein
MAQLSFNASLTDIAGDERIPTMSDVNRVFGNSTSVDIITKHLQSVLKYAGVELTASQLAETSLSILSSYWFLNLAELCLFFSQLKNGSRGQFVWGSKVNNQAIMVALHDFCIDRENTIIDTKLKEIREQKQKSYSRINDAACAMVSGVESIKKLKEEAKNDYNAFRRLFPLLPSNYKPEELWMAYGGNEDAIQAIYGENSPSPDVASDDIGKFLCEYNINRNKK